MLLLLPSFGSHANFPSAADLTLARGQQSSAKRELLSYARRQPQSISISVVGPSGRPLAVRGQHQVYATASTVKWPTMICVLHQNAGHGLSSSDRALIERMIRYSDNDAATTLLA